MTATPTLVLVPGAWHGPWCWDQVIDRMPGIDVRTVALPSCGPDPATLGDLSDDAAILRNLLRTLPGPVVVCGHSYGGAVITEAAADLPNVRRLVYLCAFQLDVGEGLALGRPKRPHWWDVHEQEGYVDTVDTVEVFYADVDPATRASVLPRLGHQSLASLYQPVTAAAWRTIPSTYVVCELDRAIPVTVQEAMAQRATHVVRLASGHSPFLSRPAELAGLLLAELAGASAGPDCHANHEV